MPFYVVGLLYLVFGVEVILLWPIAVQIREAGVHGLLEAGVFLWFLAVAFVYEWARGTLDLEFGAGIPPNRVRGRASGEPSERGVQTPATRRTVVR